MGTADQSRVNRYGMGHTTERLVRNAPVPVIAANTRGST